MIILQGKIWVLVARGRGAVRIRMANHSTQAEKLLFVCLFVCLFFCLFVCSIHGLAMFPKRRPISPKLPGGLLRASPFGWCIWQLKGCRGNCAAPKAPLKNLERGLPGLARAAFRTRAPALGSHAR